MLVFIFSPRIATENRLLACLWYGSTKPDMNLILEPLSKKLKKLYYDGKYHGVVAAGLILVSSLII